MTTSWDDEMNAPPAPELGPVIPKYQEKYISFQSDYTEALRNIRGEALLVLELSLAFVVTEAIVIRLVDSDAVRGAGVLSIIMFAMGIFVAFIRLMEFSGDVDIPAQKVPRHATERVWHFGFGGGILFFVALVCLGVQHLLDTDTEVLCTIAIIAGSVVAIKKELELLSLFDVPLPPEDAPPVPRKAIW